MRLTCKMGTKLTFGTSANAYLYMYIYLYIFTYVKRWTKLDTHSQSNFYYNSF